MHFLKLENIFSGEVVSRGSQSSDTNEKVNNIQLQMPFK